MNDFARLQDKLSKLRQKERGPGDARRLSGNNPEARLAALVTEIDETILPRRLQLESTSGAMVLAVANRRLQALLSPAPSNVPKALVDHALPDIEDPVLAELGAVLKSFFDDPKPVRISATRLAKPFGSDIGVPAGQLPRVWNVTEQQSLSPAETLKAFLDRISGKGVAWLRIEGEEVTDQGGTAKAVDALGQQAAVFLDGYFSKFDVAFGEPTDTCGTLIAGADPSQNALFFVEIGELSAIISAPEAALLQIAADWRTRTVS